MKSLHFEIKNNKEKNQFFISHINAEPTDEKNEETKRLSLLHNLRT
jgi:hypothetical protein